MALQGPFFGKKEAERSTGHVRTSPLAAPSAALGAGKASGPAFGANVSAPPASLNAASAPAPAATPSATLTVGANIKLKGVEITDCDTLVVEGEVEATIKARVIQIADKGVFKGSAEVEEAEINGVYEGELTTHQRLTILATGKVSGTVRYGRLVVEEGGQLSGDVRSAAADMATPAPASTPAVAKTTQSA